MIVRDSVNDIISCPMCCVPSRFSAPQLESRSEKWTPTTLSSNFPRSRHILGLRWVSRYRSTFISLRFMAVASLHACFASMPTCCSTAIQPHHLHPPEWLVAPDWIWFLDLWRRTNTKKAVFMLKARCYIMKPFFFFNIWRKNLKSDW